MSVNELEVLEEGKTWAIFPSDIGLEKYIYCKVCHYKSWNATDISQKFCFKCRKPHKVIEKEQDNSECADT